ncbi:hypothetical protein J5J83_13555 [Azoarcus sp. L1K30]|uniref:hypothetical protein n=1 Tax=Azoarcus sp. L1K30 TaxID=2820277 RepID=UPI001B82DC38|nr:hypothetical protein [Azoarcus sp. L1K30]MBR0567144.1 hypothetical protein [Azoarcus sp. L1K30]
MFNASRDTPSSPQHLDALIDTLRHGIVHHLATGSPRSAQSSRQALDSLGALLEQGGRTAACGGGNIEHQPALAELLVLLSRQAIATPQSDARRIARSLEALSHSADIGMGSVLRARIVELAEEWRLRERRAGDLERDHRE